ncbi:hypothetical protein ACFL43_04100 [Thermodesulfobacteriota bacterium]
MKKLSVIFLIMVMVGCAGKQQGLFQSNVLETSLESDKPEWVFNTFQVLDKEGGYLFSGGVTDVSDYALGVSEAKAEAIKNGIGSIQLKVRSEFSKFAEGSNMAPDLISKFISDGVAFIADSFYVSGIQQKQIYYEKERYNTEYRPHFNIWALCYISGVDYMKAKIDAAQRLVNKYQSEKNFEAKKKAEELLDRLRTSA